MTRATKWGIASWIGPEGHGFDVPCLDDFVILLPADATLCCAFFQTVAFTVTAHLFCRVRTCGAIIDSLVTACCLNFRDCGGLVCLWEKVRRVL